MDITQRKDIIVFFLIIILAILIGYNVIYKYNLNRIDSIKARLEEEKKKNEVLQIVSSLDKRLQEYQTRSFPTTEITQLVDKISELAQNSSIAIETFNPLPSINRGLYIELPLKIPLRCEYHQLGKLLSLIESSHELIWVKELVVQKPAVSGQREATIPAVTLTVSGLYLKK